MALPNSRDYTGIDGVSQVLSATWNSIQDFISDLYNGARTVKGLVIDGVSNVTFTRGADSPLFLSRNTASQNRWLVDHNGYPAGRRNEFREEWQINFAAPVSATSSSITPAPRFGATINAGGTINGAAPSTTYPTQFAAATVTSTSASKAFLWSNTTPFYASTTFLSLVLEFEVAATNAPIANQALYLGLGSSAGAADPSTDTSYVRLRASGTANWFAECAIGGVATSVDTGVAPTVGTFPAQRVRIELHGSTSPYGNVARFFINETLVTTISTNMPTTTMGISCGAHNISSASGQALNIGPIYMTWARYASLPAL